MCGFFQENYQLYQFQNGRLSAIINCNMPDTLQTVPDSLTITTKQNVQNDRPLAIIYFYMPDIW